MSDELHRTTEQLRMELRADVLAGRGKLPRDKSGRIAHGFFRGSETDPELPQETSVPRTADMQQLAALLAIASTAAAPALPTSKLERLEQLERELARLLSTSAPHLWRQIRAPIRRLLNRARRELRAADHADLT